VKDALCFAAAMLTTNLYVADRLQKAVIAFDVDGKKIAEYRANAVVFDVVTDSSGNVYVLYAARNGTDEVNELSHDLSTVIATYRPGGVGFNLAIDEDDNLYVGHEAQAGVSIYQYRYGSTRVAAVYRLREVGPMMLGISVRNGVIYAPVEAPFGTYKLYACTVGATNSCRLLYDISAGEDCGFTTTGSFVEVTWFGNPYTIRKFERSQFKQRGEFELPPGYGPGWNSFCALHNYATAVWLPISNSSKGPPLAIEMDMRNGDILARIGAGSLLGPVAAFFGNGFTP
jgi:hypothetical protein